MDNLPAWKIWCLEHLHYPVALFIFFIVESVSDLMALAWDDGKNASTLVTIWLLTGFVLVYVFQTWWSAIPIVLLLVLMIAAIVLSAIIVIGIFLHEIYEYIAKTINELRAQTPPRKDKDNGKS